MKELTINDLKKVSLDILVAIDKFCENNNIDYTLGYGTLIGAIRHQGFIPWDDDIDIMMPRNDYDRFIKGFNSCNDVYKLYAPELNLNYYAPYANVIDTRTYMVEFNNSHRGDRLGVKVDVFPIDGVPEDSNKYKKLCNIIKLYNQILWVKRINIFKCPSTGLKASIKLAILKMIGYVIPYTYIQKKLLTIGSTIPFEHSIWVDSLLAGSYYGKRHLRRCYDKFERVNFEGHRFLVASGFDEILTVIYGDYMKLPPIEQRVPHHSFKAWWKD